MHSTKEIGHKNNNIFLRSSGKLDVSNVLYIIHPSTYAVNQRVKRGIELGKIPLTDGMYTMHIVLQIRHGNPIGEDTVIVISLGSMRWRNHDCYI